MSAVVENGFARLVFVTSEEVESQVRVANNIITISFQRPVDVTIDRINATAGGYISRRRAIRTARECGLRSRAT